VEITRSPSGPPAPVGLPEELNYAPLRPGGGEEPQVPLNHYLWVLRRHQWRILGFVFLVVAAVLIYSLQSTPVYETAAILEIDNQAQMFEIGQGNFRFDNRNFDAVVTTQIQMMSSPEVAQQVIRELRLDRHADFNPALRDKRGKAGFGLAPSAPTAPMPASLPGLIIRRRPDTYLLEVGYRSTNPQLAAAIANAAAKAFVQQGFMAKFQNSAELSKWLNRQLDELKAKLERSQQNLRAFEKEHNVLNPADRTNILNMQLQRLQDEFTQAQTQRLQKEVFYRSAAAGGVEAAAISGLGEPLLRLADRVETLEISLADASIQYGPNHPNYRRLQAQLAHTRDLLESSRQKVLARLEADFKQATARERALAEAVATQKEEVDRLSQWTSEYSILKQEVDSQAKLYEELLKKVNEASINASIQATNLRLAGLAPIPGEPVSPKIKLNVLLALLLSAALAVGVALASDYLDRTLRSSEQVEQWLNLPVLATLPRVSGRQAPAVLLGSNGGGSESRAVAKSGVALTEALSMLRTSVLLSSPANGLQVLLVASAAPAEGKSTVASGLALTLAQQLENGSRVLLVDSDMRRPTVHSIFGLSNREGLSTLLEGQSKMADAILPCNGISNLMILPAGPAPGFSSELLTMHMAKAVENIRQEFRYIVIDSPPLLVCADATILSTVADGVLLVTRAGETPRDAVSAALRQLRRVRANVLGLVLNQVDLPDTPGYGRYYGSYYYSKKKGNPVDE
jgi:succinoglycan biosynthesis transport protein ExoP